MKSNRQAFLSLRSRFLAWSGCCLLLAFAGTGIATSAQAETTSEAAATSHSLVEWQSWSPQVFERAQKEKKLVMLDLEAIWCHWCHVMDGKTYADPAVAKYLAEHFIAIKVDQDSRPDLSNRYEDYGWPATIFFDEKGRELVKKAGYIAPDEMLSLLQALVKDPTPGPSARPSEKITYSTATQLPAELRKELLGNHIKYFDTTLGAWQTGQKYLDWDSVEFCLFRSKAGNAQAAMMAKKTLDGQLNLLDPVWGGVYQYSTFGDWKHPHFEKIMQMQGENLKVYAQAYALYKDPRYLAAAKSIYAYLDKFLKSPDGAFYTSQDADVIRGKHSDWYYKLDDAGRRSNGLPRIDKHIYARENGWAINGVVALYAATGDNQYLQAAIRAADWIEKNRSLPGGGFSHDAADKDVAGGPYLGDTLFMGRACLSLYAATGNRQWLKKAEQAANFIAEHFSTQAGFATADLKAQSVHQPEPLLDENVVAARFANLLYHYSGNQKYKQMAQTAMRYLATPAIAHKRKMLVGGILLADAELTSDPAHVTVVGSKQDKAAQTLFQAANRYPATYKRLDWYDRSEGALPNTEVEYPELPVAAAFACAGKRCSIPIKNAERLAGVVDALTGSAATLH